ncbi:hypothetical protein M747DRAFT_164828 [Aspergillus niger ATCC 13496]|uniref:Uncharacterized protein n=1 Tax=Aspergillus niger ATCC 13496 TaxID=1353008 RepID=A0A370CAG9_ASPNG|nr:hypothetical protein M747DRAFT_164828 [Aspergillus niger ATCC 13496]
MYQTELSAQSSPELTGAIPKRGGLEYLRSIVLSLHCLLLLIPTTPEPSYRWHFYCRHQFPQYRSIKIYPLFRERTEALMVLRASMGVPLRRETSCQVRCRLPGGAGGDA